MLYFSYRTRRRLKTTAIVTLIVVSVLALFAVGTFLYLQRYLVYTPQGAYLDFDQKQEENPLNPSLSVQVPTIEDPVIEYAQNEQTAKVDSGRLQGYYITGDQLAQANQITIPNTGSRTAVMMDFVSDYGNYYFPNSLSGATYVNGVNTIDTAALLEDLGSRSDIYLIASLPAFQNSTLALTYQNDGLPISGGALWMDADGCYWMDPGKETTLTYLDTMVYMAMELGFDEIVFQDFYFPDSENIVYDGDRDGVILEAAERLSNHAAKDSIAISFGSSDTEMAVYGTRLYLENGNASLIGAMEMALPKDKSPSKALVFTTDSRDTRFEGYGLLKPYLLEE